jgi:5-methyltetrahydropteroyltriglutamate--homocysteine methyltransferase
LDADVVQVDEANLPGAPEEWEWAARVMNIVLDAIPGTSAVHLCFGNYGGQVSQKGANWEPLIAYLNALHADHVVCENAHRPIEELEVFRELRPGIGMGLGVIDVKATEIESAETVARRIERAAEVIGPDRIAYVHPDCGLWNLRRFMADGKITAVVVGRDLYEGRPGSSVT